MGTTAEKGQRVLQSIAEVQEGINNIGGSLTDQTPFKNFRAELDNIYNNLPKTEYQEGSNITLSNCLKGKLDYEDDKVGYGDTYQGSTQGYNLLNSAGGSIAYKPEGTITIDSNGVINASTNMGYTSINIPSITLKAGTTYTFERNFTGSYNSLLVDTNGNNVLGIGYNKASVTATIESDVTINKLNGTLLSGDNYFWLYEGSTQKPFEKYTNGPAPNPTYPFPVKCVTGEQEVTIRGKNIAKLDQTYNTNNAQITYSENVPSSIVGTKTQQVGQFLATFTGQIEKGKTYTIGGNATQCYVYAYSDNIGGTIINSIQNLPLPVIFTANYTGFCLFALYFRSLDTGTASIKNFQVEEGSTATDYEPYITPITKTLNLGNLEFAEIGTYRDYIWTDRETGKWYVHSEIDKIVSYNGETISTTYMSTTGQLTTGATVYYGKTATDTEITDTSLISQLEDIYNIMSNNGTTIIEIAGELPMIIKARALKGE